MKRKIFALIIFVWLLAACTPDAIVPTPEVESRPTGIPTIQPTPTTAAAETAVPPTPELPSPTPEPETAAATPETAAFTPRFDIFLPLDGQESTSSSLTGLVRRGESWQIASIRYPQNLNAAGSDYAPATDRLLVWGFAGGAGPGNLAVGNLFIVNVATKEQTEVVPENVVSAGWAPNGLDFAYILATPTTYELRWRTADGEDRLLAVDVPHSLRVSPNGRYVAFTRESHYEVDSTPPGLYVVDVVTGSETQISPLDRAGYGGTGSYWKPHWTPDSRQVLLFATADDDRAETPHEEGYAWAAVDGRFAHFLPSSAFRAFFTEALDNPDNVRCTGTPALFATNSLVMPVGECPPMGPANPETAQLAFFTLDPQTGAVELENVLAAPQSARLLTWDEPGESVLMVDVGEVFSLSVTAAAAATTASSPSPTTVNRCLDANAAALPLPPAQPASWVYSEGGNLKLWQEGMGTAVSLTTSGDVKSGQRSPDGALVAFVRTVPQQTAELWVVSADGQNERRLATVSLADYMAQAEAYVVDVQLHYSWLPQSHKLAYLLSPSLDALGTLPNEATSIVDADTGSTHLLYAGGEVWHTRFSPDGRLSVTFVDNGLRLIDTATGQLLHNLALPGSGSPDQTVSFSPDGRFLIAFATGGVAVIDTSSGSLNLIPLEYVTIGAGHFAIWPSMQWLPDGRSFLTVVSNTENVWGNPDTTFTVWQVDAAAQTAVPLHTFAGDPTVARFSANGRYLAFYKIASSQSNTRELYLADLESGEIVLYDRGQAVEVLSWHPNGMQFVYWFWDVKRPLLGSLCGEPVEIPGPGSDLYQLYWQSNDQYVWYMGQPDNPDNYFNSEGDWTLFRGSLSGETTQLWQYRGLYPSY